MAISKANSASHIILEIDSPHQLLYPWQRRQGQHFCTWPARFGGVLSEDFPHLNDGHIRDVVRYEFPFEGIHSRPFQAFEYTIRFFANQWRDSCLGEAVVVTLYEGERILKQIEQVIGNDDTQSADDRIHDTIGG